MSYLTRRTPARKMIDAPDLFSWRPYVTPDRAARRIADRYGLSIAHAALIARHAGLGTRAR